MNVLILTESFPPETKSASTLFFELAESLVMRKYRVSVVTRKPNYYIAEGTDLSLVPDQEVFNGINVFRRKIPNLARNIPLIRGIEHFIIGILLFFEALKVKNVDLILVYLPPLPLGITGFLLSKLRKKPIIVNIHDLYPQTVIDLGLLTNKFLIWLSRIMESAIYKNADYFAVPYESNKSYLIKHGVKEENISIVPNWADTEKIKPGEKVNDFSRKHAITDKFVVSFTGSMGFAQGLEVMIKTADKLRDNQEIEFILVGDGIMKKKLQSMAVELKLNNIKFIAPQALNSYPQVLHSSDLCLVILREDFGAPAVPGKLLSIMAAGRPVITSLPLDGETPKIVNEHNCGICVEPNSPDSLATAILKLYNNRELREQMGQAGRNASVKFFSRQIAVKNYEEIFKKVSDYIGNNQ